MTSERLNADALEDPDDEDLHFDNLSRPMEILVVDEGDDGSKHDDSFAMII
jgi:hypothetical protein